VLKGKLAFMTNNYFERGLPRKGSTIRTPIALQKELKLMLLKINDNSNINISMNDLLTIGNILLTSKEIDCDLLKKANSLHDICNIIIQNKDKQTNAC
jgi:hypothetical protein